MILVTNCAIKINNLEIRVSDVLMRLYGFLLLHSKFCAEWCLYSSCSVLVWWS